MDIAHAVIYGIVEGLTEFLPVSSTGHLMLTSKILGNNQTEFLKSFEIAIQFGAILSVVVLYWRKFFVESAALKRVLVGFFPTVVLGLLLYPIVRSVFLENVEIVVWALLLGGIAIVVFEKFHKEKENAVSSVSEISYPKAFLVGVFQVAAMVPGVSRSAATILGGLGAGLSRKTIVEFSFLLAVPTMLGAAVLDLYKNVSAIAASEFYFLAVGFIVSFVIALFSIKFFLAFIKKHSFVPFGAYRIVLAAIFMLFVL